MSVCDTCLSLKQFISFFLPFIFVSLFVSVHLRLISMRPFEVSFTCLSLSSRRYDAFQNWAGCSKSTLVFCSRIRITLAFQATWIRMLLCVLLSFHLCVCTFSSCSPVVGMRLHFVSYTKFIQSEIVCLFRLVDFFLTRKENFTVTVWM